MSPILHYAIPLFILLILVELAFGRFTGRKFYEVKDTFASLGMGVGNVVVSTAWKAASVGLYFLVYEHFRIFDFGMGVWWAWLLLIFAEDLCYYAFHRSHHEVRFLWAGHVNHHSSQRYNLSTALRQSWTTPITGFLFWLPLPLLGFHPVMVLTAQAISLLYQFWIHTEAVPRLGPLEWIFNTPSHHRVHHGSNLQYLDRNHAGIFIIWDRLFGTFEPEQEPVHYGLTTNIDTYNPFKIAFHEWAAIWRDMKRARNWRERAGYALRPPGWSPDGSSLTARQLRAQQPPGSITP